MSDLRPSSEVRRLTRSSPQVSFGMLVKNGARFLRACLESVSALCDEMIVVDTGSQDESKEIARSFAATVIDVPWTDDFAAARNIYVERARGDWILSLDADETLGRLSKAALTDAIARRPGTAFVFDIRNYFLENDVQFFVLPSRIRSDAPVGTRCVISRTVRLFPRRRGLRYTYPLHESLLPGITRTGTRIGRCSVPIHHMGGLYRRENGHEKTALYASLGRKKIAQYPEYFLGYLELGQVCLEEGDLDEAAQLFTRALALRSGCLEAECYLALVLLRRGHYDRCRLQLETAMRRAPTNADLRHVLGLLTTAESAPRLRVAAETA